MKENKIYGQLILQSGFGYGPSKKLQPLAENAIKDVEDYDIECSADKKMLVMNNKL